MHKTFPSLSASFHAFKYIITTSSAIFPHTQTLSLISPLSLLTALGSFGSDESDSVFGVLGCGMLGLNCLADCSRAARQEGRC